MYIELKEIDKDTLKVGDVVGVMRPVRTGWYSQIPAHESSSGKDYQNHSEKNKKLKQIRFRRAR